MVDVASLLLEGPLPRLEVRLLLQAVLQCSLTALFSAPERTLDDAEIALFRALQVRRQHGEPMAYLLGEREFYGLSFLTTPAVLIPRPETEGLVDWGLETSAPQVFLHCLDLGTGSGALALSLQYHRPRWQVSATDRSAAALDLAQKNAARLLPPSSPVVHWYHGDWYEALPEGETFDLIVSNPPYIAAADPHLDQGDLRFEPRQALTAGPSGTEDLERIIAQAPLWLKPGGILRVEHGYDQGEFCRSLFVRAGFTQVTTRTDLAGLERLTGGHVGMERSFPF
ncbi:peptide chain release factor N(5)-glutamine methyltransferase [Ferrovum sp.]|uniref:peptide chain release factor N(5)-glutamine methyltransferase n=1 Tax=Ferrovum sp. TaxID=2609467 RepID=UPI002619E7F4|nr:peptide chain release factor N(5)-glutamine methyltransferase [Ferrovum sp.]